MKRTAAALAASTLTATLVALAEPPGLSGPELRVNTYTTSTQRNPRVAVNPDGGFMIVWHGVSEGTLPGHLVETVARRYAPGGVPIGAELRVNTLTTSLQFEPAVAALGAGTFVVVWTDSIGDGNGNAGILGRRIGPGGPLGPEFRVNADTPLFQAFPAVAADANGFVVVFSTAFTGGAQDVFGQRFGAAGELVGGEFRVNTYTTGSQYQAAVAKEAGGGFFVVWRSSGQEGPGFSVFGRRFAATGEASGPEVRVNTTFGDDQEAPAIASVADGTVVVWRRDGSPIQLLGQRYSATGSPLGGEFVIDPNASGIVPSVAAGPAGGFVVAWSDTGYGDLNDALLRAYSSSGSPDGEPFRVNTYTTRDQFDATVGSSSGTFVVAWASYGQDGSLYGVFGQRLCATPTGDVNADDAVNVSDVLYLINNLFAGGPAPLRSGNVNGDSQTNVSDILYLINHLFAGGPSPLCG